MAPTLFLCRLRVRRLIGISFFVLVCACNPEEDDLIDPSQINTWSFYDRNDGLASDHVTALFEAGDGRLWIGTNDGLSVFDGADFISYDASDGFVNEWVYAIDEDNEGNIWVGTAGGLMVFFEGDWINVAFFEGVGVPALLNSDDGMLMGTDGYGVWVYNDDEEFEEYLSFNCSGCNNIVDLMQSSDESIWVATFNGVYKKRAGSAVKRFSDGNGLNAESAFALEEDRFGNIWVGGDVGLTRIIDDEADAVSMNNGLETNLIWSLAEDNRGRLWIATRGAGLYVHDGGYTQRVYTKLPDDVVMAVRQDRRGNMWVGTIDGLGKFTTNPD